MRSIQFYPYNTQTYNGTNRTTNNMNHYGNYSCRMNSLNTHVYQNIQIKSSSYVRTT